MATSQLPPRASLEYLKKLAKDRLKDLRAHDPAARLSSAQLLVAREHGFPSWRALRSEVARRVDAPLASFAEACARGDVAEIAALLEQDPQLVRSSLAGGTTGLHLAVAHPEAVRLLLARGAHANARDTGDRALPLHFAAGGGHLESVRALLDAGSEVQGEGDAHRLDAIGWATVFGPAHPDVVHLLVQRGARHHVFSAVALNGPDLLRGVVRHDPAALERRLAATEQEQTALHYVIAPPDGLVGGLFRTGEHYRTLEALIELGADVNARDLKGRTPLEVAMLRGDREAARRLHEAGAEPPRSTPAASGAAAEVARATRARSIRSLTPMLAIPDLVTTVAWYQALGFELLASHGEEGRMEWASVKMGPAEIMFTSSTVPWRERTAALSLWLHTDRLDEIYASLKAGQLERSRAELAGEQPTMPEIRFSADLYTAFYGQREFCVVDPNGIEINFAQPTP